MSAPAELVKPDRAPGHDWLLGTACFMFSAVFWGMNVPMTSRLFRTWDPFFLAPLRVVISALVLALLVVATRGVRELAWPIRPSRLALLSLAQASFFTFYNLGLRYSNPITAAAVMAGAPVYAAVTLKVLSRAPLERGFAVAATLTCIGAWVAIQGRPGGGGHEAGFGGGEVLIVLAFVCWNLYSLGSQRWFAPQVAQLRRTYVVTLASIPWLILSWALARANGIVGAPTLHPDSEAVVLLLMTAVLATALAVFTWNIGIQRAGLAAGSLWQNMVPVFAVLIALLFGIRPTPAQLLGGVIVLAGVGYMQWRRITSPR